VDPGQLVGGVYVPLEGHILGLILLSGRRSDVGRLSGRLTDGCEEIKLGQMLKARDDWWKWPGKGRGSTVVGVMVGLTGEDEDRVYVSATSRVSE